MKYTKERWIARNIKEYPRFNDLPFVTNNEGLPICNLCGGELSEVEANAKLISKCPEMYESLQEEVLFLERILPMTFIATAATSIEERINYLKSLLKEIES